MSLDLRGWSSGSFPARTVRSSSRLATGGWWLWLDDDDSNILVLVLLLENFLKGGLKWNANVAT